eukprot:EG_transcript_20019
MCARSPVPMECRTEWEDSRRAEETSVACGPEVPRDQVLPGQNSAARSPPSGPHSPDLAQPLLQKLCSSEAHQRAGFIAQEAVARSHLYRLVAQQLALLDTKAKKSLRSRRRSRQMDAKAIETMASVAVRVKPTGIPTVLVHNPYSFGGDVNCVDGLPAVADSSSSSPGLAGCPPYQSAPCSEPVPDLHLPGRRRGQRVGSPETAPPAPLGSYSLPPSGGSSPHSQDRCPVLTSPTCPTPASPPSLGRPHHLDQREGARAAQPHRGAALPLGPRGGGVPRGVGGQPPDLGDPQGAQEASRGPAGGDPDRPHPA